MFEQLFHLILAALGLGLLIFIHELGHYLAAKKCKMSVETFSIGFGKPIKTWMSDGVKWQIGSLPFGGYVKIRDLDSSDPAYATLENRPLAKIIVSLAGPAANLILCFLLFSLIWVVGGRVKTFNEVSPTVSFVDAKGRFSEAGMLPGDTIKKIDGHPYQDIGEFLLFQVAGSGDLQINRFDFHAQMFSPMSLHIPPHNPPLASGAGGFHPEVLPAQFVIVAEDKAPFTTGERIVWANGAPVFSGYNLRNLLNEEKAFFSIIRKGEVLSTRLPLIHLNDLRLSQGEKSQLEDWAAEQHLSQAPVMMIPYLFNQSGIITASLVYTAHDTSEKVFKFDPKDPYSVPLETGDQIVMANGHRFESGPMTLSVLQQKEATIITQKAAAIDTVTVQQAEDAFWTPWKNPDYHELMTRRDLTTQNLRDFQVYAALPLKEVATEDLKKIRLALDIPHKDVSVLYNPAPWTLFGESLSQSGRTIYFLVSGGLSPSMLSGPIGIVKSMHNSFERSWREAIYWIGFISLSLAVFNLLPIPVLDGGMVLFFTYELVSGRRVSAKTMQKFIIPAVVLLIGFMLYVTYSDVLRLF